MVYVVESTGKLIRETHTRTYMYAHVCIEL